MARDGSGNYSLPANTLAVSGDPISSTKFNSLVQDLEADANVDRPIAAGGTGASTAAGARTNLGLVIGTDVQAFDAGLLSIAGLTTAADRSIYTTASDTYAVYTLTAAGRALLDDADASAQRTTLGLANGATTTFSAFALSLADDADAATSRTTLGLGTIATQNANSVSITGGSISGITDLAIADGGTGASDAGTARTNLGLGSLATLNSINNGNWSGTALAIANGGTGATSAGAALTALGALPAASYTAADVLSKLLTVDGAGSGLDADTLDGLQGSAFAQLAGTQTITGAKTFSSESGTTFAPGSGGTGGGGVVGLGEYVTLTGLAPNIVFNDTSATINNWFITMNQGTVIIGDVVSGTPTSRFDLTNTLAAFNVPLQARAAASATTTGTLTSASANKTIQATGDITIPNSVFAAADIILIYAGASARTITQGSGVTMRLDGTATTGNRTLAARGVAMLFFVSASEVIVAGGAVS